MSPKAEKWQPTPTFWVAGAALVIALAAFVVSVSGIATASPKVIVRKGDIAPGAVTAKALAKGAVTAPKIQKATITGAKLADGSVTAEQLADGSVTSSKLGAGSVTSPAIAPGAVTAGAIAPGSIHGSALGPETVVSKSIADLDADPHNGEWTPSNTEAAACGTTGALLGTGFAATTIGNAQVSWLQALPIINAEFHGVTGRISTDDGGAAVGQVLAICLE
jgi:hypothetical protein